MWNIFGGRDGRNFCSIHTQYVFLVLFSSPFHNTNITASSFAAFQKIKKAASYLEPSQTSAIVLLTTFTKRFRRTSWTGF